MAAASLRLPWSASSMVRLAVSSARSCALGGRVVARRALAEGVGSTLHASVPTAVPAVPEVSHPVLSEERGDVFMVSSVVLSYSAYFLPCEGRAHSRNLPSVLVRVPSPP